MKKSLFAISGLLLLTQVLFGCSAEDDNSCSRASDCERGTVCLEDGSCGVYACTGAGQCSATPPFVEGCLLADSTGAYDPSLEGGVCSAQECRSSSECRGEEAQCIDNICYSSVAANIPCTSRDTCPPGQACMAGICDVNDDGFCADINECPTGQTCDESHVCVADGGACDPACGDGETCVDGACQPATVTCDPACGDGETCVDGACVPEGDVGSICETCTADSECGGVQDRCVILAGRDPFCSVNCNGSSCPSGYSCEVVDTAGSQQCVPTNGAACGGCLIDGCDAGQFCDAPSGSCMTAAGICEECLAADQCAGGAQCLSIGGSPHCLATCADGCDAGYACTTISGREVCAPETGSCDGGASCELTAADCTGTTSVFDETNCRCVGCLSASDCGADQLCSDTGSCLSGSGTCTSTAECGDGYCQSGVCIECLGNSDCDGQPCIAGACEECDCPAGQRCSPIDGSCEDIPATGDCTTDTECIQAAQALGHDGSGVYCDPNVGCFVSGKCGGVDMLGMPLTDGAFDAACPIGLTCSSNLLAQGEGVCTGCDPSNPNSCRIGESCIDFLGTAVCTGGLGF